MIIATVAISGCAGNARHSQCQELKSEASGAQWGAVLAGTYAARIEANMDNARYERCEEMFDLVQYQAQINNQDAENKNSDALPKSNKATKIADVKSASLQDLESCERSGDDATMAYRCEQEINRRNSDGKAQSLQQ
ncbi:hypothetical protein SEESL791_016345 [Salmonella enterica subsp. enterica serovar Sloterdijk str. ATCC 15791]|uniref:hypothetical protein n=1 Tax=Salmonella enterica TaxID=28901 RepID=UPI0003BC5977|nr:hypothetical protein [Salmonella enterica]AKW16659.1 hypothetical protein SEESL791_016345 [Salmonella enterica subsp. enterica serovar Sloterdijk str. ATCC 15791]